MPFKSKSQRRLCYAKYAQDVKAGKKPAWDCPKWDQETPDIESLPWKVSSSNSPSKNSPSKNSPSKNKKLPMKLQTKANSLPIHVGPKGGKYTVDKRGKKTYINSKK